MTPCIICNSAIVDYGNNAQPVADGICCDHCNSHYVIPCRMSPPTIAKGFVNHINQAIKSGKIPTDYLTEDSSL